MLTTDEIIDLIRTGYIPPDPGRLGEFGRIVDALNERRSTEPLGDERLREIECTRKIIGEECVNRRAAQGEEFYGTGTQPGAQRLIDCVNAVPVLLQEIRRLQAELKTAQGTYAEYAKIATEERDDLRAQLAAAQKRIAKLDSDIDRRIEDHRRLLASIAELGKASAARGQEVARLRGVLTSIGSCSSDERAIEMCGEALFATPAATPAVEQSDTDRDMPPLRFSKEYRLTFETNKDDRGRPCEWRKDTHEWGNHVSRAAEMRNDTGHYRNVLLSVRTVAYSASPWVDAARSAEAKEKADA